MYIVHKNNAMELSPEETNMLALCYLSQACYGIDESMTLNYITFIQVLSEIKVDLEKSRETIESLKKKEFIQSPLENILKGFRIDTAGFAFNREVYPIIAPIMDEGYNNFKDSLPQSLIYFIAESWSILNRGGVAVEDQALAY